MSNPVLPALYDKWLAPLIGTFSPESRATCSDCAMCDKPNQRAAAAYPFRPDVKCCVYQPDLPNFLVGRILADQETDSSTVSLRISNRIGVSPWGVRSPPAYKLLHKKSANAIGRSTELRCPHFVEETQGCGIHRHRNHLCATWFCKHERGLIGYTFWRAIHELLKSVEEELACWCALELGLSANALHLLKEKEQDAPTDASEIEGNLSDHVYNAFWGNWAGREDEYYRECGRLVNDLKGDAVIALCGSRTRVQLEIARGAWERLSNTELPSQLTCGSYQLLGVQEGGLSAITYSSTDPIGLPSPLLPLLHHFDGRPTTEILEELLQEHGVQLEEDLLKKLVDWGILG